mmetsp:Transcript_26735/g.62789  ORF Transcript_26735/g.62789 Transcript_26735/m.62789 type:complete len:158 (-) Transcript_26735:10-483(-)
MKPADVWAMQPEFVEVKYENFRNNFARMKRTIKEHKNRAEIDEAGFLHDISLYPLAKDSDGAYWDGSEAQRLLKIDIERKRNEWMKPEYLQLSRPDYQEFELKKFRGHLHQELRSKREKNYWIVKKAKKKQVEEARKSGKPLNDEDMDFLYNPVLSM